MTSTQHNIPDFSARLPQYLAIPYLSCGRTVAGADCWGLARIVYQAELGIELPMLSYGDSNDRAQTTVATLAEREAWQQVEAPQPCDIVILRVVGTPCHCGIMVTERIFLHSLDGMGPSLDSVEGIRWSRRIEGFYRWSAPAA